MKDLILGLAAVALVGTYAVLISWIVIEKRKTRQERKHLAKYIRAREVLNLTNKPRLLPKHGQGQPWVGTYGHVYDTRCRMPDNEIEVIQMPKQRWPDPEELETNCRRFKGSENPHFRKFLEEAERISFTGKE